MVGEPEEPFWSPELVLVRVSQVPFGGLRWELWGEPKEPFWSAVLGVVGEPKDPFSSAELGLVGEPAEPSSVLSWG